MQSKLLIESIICIAKMPRSFFWISRQDHLRDDKLPVQRKSGGKLCQNPENGQNEPKIRINTRDKKTQPPVPGLAASGYARGGSVPYYL